MDGHQLDAISRRPLRNWNEDGLPDIVLGATMLVLSGVFAAMYHNNPWGVVVLIPAWLLLLGPLGRRALRRAKERLTFPRTGRIEPRRHKLEWKKALLAWLGMMGVWGLLTIAPEPDRWLPAAAALLFAGLFAWIGRQLESPRHLIMAVLMAALAFALAAFGWHDQRDFIALFLVMGSVLILCGAVALASFLHSTPPAPQE